MTPGNLVQDGEMGRWGSLLPCANPRTPIPLSPYPPDLLRSYLIPLDDRGLGS